MTKQIYGDDDNNDNDGNDDDNDVFNSENSKN